MNAAPHGSPKTLAELEAENQQLRAQIARYEKDVSDRLPKLAEASDQLAEQIKEYAAVAEDVWGLRVFESAKSYLIRWITVGGIATVLAGVALFVSAWNYLAGQAKTAIESAVRTDAPQILQSEVQKQVSAYLQQQQPTFATEAEQMLQQMLNQVVSSMPIAGTKNRTTGASGAATGLSPSLDYSAQMQAVRDQGNEGSVVGFAMGYAIEFQVTKALSQTVRLSPREIYNLARTAEHSLTTDSGAIISDAVNVVKAQGAVADAVWPYKAGEYAAQPPPAFAAATRYKVGRAAKVANTPDAIKTALAGVGPIVIGITVYQSFEAADVAKTGMVPLPKAGETLLGGHAVCIVGFDDTKKQFKFINSWGNAWGDHGYGYLPYGYIANNSSDAWSLSR
jgi:C1A family cysteine protease